MTTFKVAGWETLPRLTPADLLNFGCIDLYVWSWTEHDVFEKGTAKKIGAVLFAKHPTDPNGDPNDAEEPFFEPVNGVCVSVEQTESINNFIGVLESHRRISRLDDIESVLEQMQNNPVVM